MKFGKKHVVVKAHLDSITKGPPIKADRESLDKLATDMANCHITLVQWGYDSELNSSQTLLDVFKRLPVHLQRKFSDKVDVYSIGYAATFSQLLSFVEDAADRANSLFGEALAQPVRYNQSCPRKPKSGQVFSAQSITVDEKHCLNNSRVVCPSCNCNNHTLPKCRKFLRKPLQERWHFVKGKRLCFNCLGSDHVSRDCKCELKCKVCSRLHHTVLHREFARPNRRSNPSSSIEPNPPLSAESTTTDSSVTVSVHTGSYKVRLMVLPVRVYDEDHTTFVDTYGFLDSGSEMSFCTTSLMKKLHLKGKEVTKNIVGLSGSCLHHGRMVSLSMKGLAESNVIRIRNVFAIDALPKLAESIPSNNDVKRYEHLRGLNFPEVHSKEVEVLIGAAVLEAHEMTESKYGKDAQPKAVRTGLGWTLVGPEPCFSGKKECSVNFLRTEQSLRKQMLRMINHEFSEDRSNADDKPFSVEDELFLHLMEESAKKVDGHYQLPLPWKDTDIRLPFNRSMALQRLHSLKRKLERNASLFALYQNSMDALLRDGYARNSRWG